MIGEINFFLFMTKQTDISTKLSFYTKLYLSAYNTLLSTGCLYVFFHILAAFFNEGVKSFAKTYSDLSHLLIFLQFVLMLDILHAILGFWTPSKIPLYYRLFCKVFRRAHLMLLFNKVVEVHEEV